MKKVYKNIGYYLLAISLLNSCAKPEKLEFVADKPSSLLDQEELDSYGPLKSYLNKSTNPNFKWGVALNMDDYINKKVMYRLANTNFEEMVIGYEMKHASIVQNNGKLELTKLKKFIQEAKNSKIDIFGHTLCWHSGQNATYLNSLIAPIKIPGAGPSWDIVTSNDFETNNDHNYQYNSNALVSFTANGEGANGKGRALKIVNSSVREQEWDVQFFIKFEPTVKEGEQYRFSINVKSDANATFGTQAHTVPYAYKHWEFFGQITSTPKWSTYEKEITITKDMAESGTIAFNLGKNATTYYFDNFTLTKYNKDGGSASIEKTAEEKKLIITAALEEFIAGMTSATKDYIKAWDVVNEPMSDWPNQYELKTGVGNTDLPADEFYWQDYMGKDYAVKAIEFARKYGNPNDKLFINDYGLEGGGDKCKGLIAYIEYVESKGAKVDGIGTQMHINIDNDKGNIVKMLELLAASGKLIKISELDIGMGNGIKTPNATEKMYHKQAEMYKFVIEKYFEIIPKAQQYGITLWSPLDSPDNQFSFWRRGEPIGIWTETFIRKKAYKAIIEALGK